MDRVNVGIVGLGLAGYQLHAKAYAQIPAANIHALCTRDEAKLERIARELGVRNTYTDYDRFLQDDALQAVSICVTDPLHFEFARKAVQAGKHVLCEKPLGTSLEEVRGLVALMRGKKTSFAVGQVYRFVPQFVAIKRMLDEGRLGGLFHVDCDYQQDMRELYKVTPWRRDDKSWNSWVAGGAHVVDLARYIGGDVDEVVMYANKGEEDPDCGPLEDNHLSIMKLKNGATCKVWEVRCIKRAPEFTINLGVFGGRGSACGSFLDNEVRYFSLDQGDKQAGFASLFAQKVEGIPIRYELEDFLSSILNDHAPRCDVVSGARTIATVLAGVEAQEKGRPVKVPEVE
ncbi:MAG: Gfo/Idh/MocA family oxidoreductase [Spirochaetales bacterium]|nr:Gfo/Idh/MocA family oxidoreductase [Spirochaetales bacterium]